MHHNVTDKREEKHFKTHTCCVTAVDTCMSGWGSATNGLSYCVWVCKPQHVDQLYDWVCSRDEMKNVNFYYSFKKMYPKKNDHLAIYVVKDNHPCLD